MSDAVLTEYGDGVAVITINRPEARNAVDRAVAEGVAAALDVLDARDDLTVGVITGTGGTFCAGMDLKAFLRGERPVVEGRGLAGLTEAPPAKPLIAAVEGHALAGGCEIVLACDLVVAAEDARFGLPEVKRGLVAAAGGLMRLPERIPRQVAMELALTGGFLDAPRAHALGLVNRLTANGGALAGARALAAEIAANGPLAVRATKRIVTEAPGWPAAERWRRQRALIDPVFASEDAKEGPRAFAEKRAPRWTGR
ncbi:crotonase/enoyl-CoA hydratase family protein [Kitasatospora sp. NPDC004272]